MKMLVKLILGIIWGLAVSPALAGWGENVRLTYRGQEIRPQVIARNDTVHVVWFQIDDKVSYIRSTDGSETWEQIIDLTETNHRGIYANLNLDDNGLLVSWLDYNENEGISSIGIATSAILANRCTMHKRIR